MFYFLLSVGIMETTVHRKTILRAKLRVEYWKHPLKEKEESETEAFIISIFKWLPICLFNVIGLIPIWEMESSVLTAAAWNTAPQNYIVSV